MATPPTCGVTLTPHRATAGYPFTDACRLRVTATDPVGFDGGVFLFRRGPADPLTGEPLDTLIGVPSAVELADYPLDAPDPAGPNLWFRADVFEVDLPSEWHADQLFDAYQQQVLDLCNALTALQSLAAGTPVRVGAPELGP